MNRELSAGICLLLAFKLNEAGPHGGNSVDVRKVMEVCIDYVFTSRQSFVPCTLYEKIRACPSNSNYEFHHIQVIESVFGIKRADVIRAEFFVICELEFGLNLPQNEILPHFSRLLQAMDTVPQVCCTIVSPDSLFNV